MHYELRESTDRELVAWARQGSEDALGELLARHYPGCVKLATYMLRDHGAAFDEVQNACRKAFERLDQYHGEGEFATWLRRIVANQCLMYLRARRQAKLCSLDHSPENGSRPIEVRAREADPEQQFLDRELLVVLRTEMRRIPPLLRNILMMHHIEELPMTDVATRLNITVAAAKSRLYRARTELRNRLMPYYGDRGIAFHAAITGA